MSSDRRRSPRIEILGRLHGQVTSLAVSVTVREISVGGLSMETAFEFPVGVIHDFRLEMGDGSLVDLRGKVLRSRAVRAADGSRLYISGVQFIDDDDDDDDGPTVEDLVDRLK